MKQTKWSKKSLLLQEVNIKMNLELNEQQILFLDDLLKQELEIKMLSETSRAIINQILGKLEMWGEQKAKWETDVYIDSLPDGVQPQDLQTPDKFNGLPH